MEGWLRLCMCYLVWEIPPRMSEAPSKGRPEMSRHPYTFMRCTMGENPLNLTMDEYWGNLVPHQRTLELTCSRRFNPSRPQYLTQLLMFARKYTPEIVLPLYIYLSLSLFVKRKRGRLVWNCYSAASISVVMGSKK